MYFRIILLDTVNVALNNVKAVAGKNVLEFQIGILRIEIGKHGICHGIVYYGTF